MEEPFLVCRLFAQRCSQLLKGDLLAVDLGCECKQRASVEVLGEQAGCQRRQRLALLLQLRRRRHGRELDRGDTIESPLGLVERDDRDDAGQTREQRKYSEAEKQPERDTPLSDLQHCPLTRASFPHHNSSNFPSTPIVFASKIRDAVFRRQKMALIHRSLPGGMVTGVTGQNCHIVFGQTHSRTTKLRPISDFGRHDREGPRRVNSSGFSNVKVA